ncbi:MAG: hypothetical protein ABSG56_10825 [Bryobacteraceae bacterium]|jgi:hypothetical protein
MTRRSPFLIFFLAFVSAIFIGILIFVYIVTKQTNPVMLDDKGRPQPTASLHESWGGQSWPQPPFRRPEPVESRLRAELPAPQFVPA